MITGTEIWEIMKARLDAEGSDRYLPDQDIIPAINTSIRRAATAIGWALANRKGSEEQLSELTFVRVFQTNSQGGVSLNDPSLGHGVWNVLGVYARPEVVGTPSINPIPQNQSQYRADLAWSGSGDPVERVTLEEVPKIRTNIFRNGNEILANNPNRVTFSYYIPGNASSTNYSSGPRELRILPQSVTATSIVAIAYLKEPSEITSLTDSVEFPSSMKDTLASWALQNLAYKQGDGTTLNILASQDAAQLFGFQAVN
jgi:hypothetical protein